MKKCFLIITIILTSMLKLIAAEWVSPIPEPKELQINPKGESLTSGSTGYSFQLLTNVELNHLHSKALAKLPITQTKSNHTLQLNIIENQDNANSSGFSIEIDNTGVKIIGNDSNGLRYGLLTLEQILRDNPKQIPALKLNDWPTLPNHSIPLMLHASSDYLDFVAEKGRVTAGFLEFYRMNPTTEIPEEVNWDEYKRLIERCHQSGIKVSALPGYFLHRIYKIEKRSFCPSRDMSLLLAEYKKAIEAGVDGLSIHFDDIFAMPEEVTHYKACAQCKTKFTSLAELQAWCMQEVYKLGKSHGINMFWACPSLYSDHGTGDYNSSYGKMDPSLSEKSYFPVFCDFPGSDEFRFYYAYYDKGIGQRLRRDGLKNFMWWNNGVWSGGHGEVFGAYVSFPKMLYSWDFYDYQAMEQRYEEKFNLERYKELANIADNTDFIYTGSYDAIGIALGGIFAWNPKAYINNEEKVRCYLWRDLFGAKGDKLITEWETISKPLWIKSQFQKPFSDKERTISQRLVPILSELQANKRYGESVYALSLPYMPKVIENINSFLSLLSPWKEAKGEKLRAWKNPQAIFNFGIKRGKWANGVDYELKTVGEKIIPMRFNGVGGMMFEHSKINIMDQAFTLAKHNFTVILSFTPTRFGNNYFTQLAGVRDTYRDYYPGFPGWGIGLDGPGQRIRFTVEDENKNVNNLSTAAGELLQNQLATVVAIRDFDKRQLRLYLNGKLIQEIPEKGNGNWPSTQQNLQIGYDNMGGGYFVGGIHKIMIFDRVLNDKEIAEFFKLEL